MHMISARVTFAGRRRGDEPAGYDSGPEPHQSADDAGRPADVTRTCHLLALLSQGALQHHTERARRRPPTAGEKWAGFWELRGPTGRRKFPMQFLV